MDKAKMKYRKKSLVIDAYQTKDPIDSDIYHSSQNLIEGENYGFVRNW